MTDIVTSQLFISARGHNTFENSGTSIFHGPSQFHSPPLLPGLTFAPTGGYDENVIGRTVAASNGYGVLSYDYGAFATSRSDPSFLYTLNNVGIGVTAGTYPLQVKGTMAATGVQTDTIAWGHNLKFTSGGIELGRMSDVFQWGVASAPSLPRGSMIVGQDVFLGGHFINGNGTFALPPLSDELVGTSQPQTLSQKTLEAPVLTGDVTLTGGRITNLGAPQDRRDATTKEYVDHLIHGLNFQDAVQARVASPPDRAFVHGERYLVTEGVGVFAGHDHAVATFTASSDNGVTDSAWVFNAAEPGFACFVENENTEYVFNMAGVWVVMARLMAHGALEGLEDDDHPQYLRWGGRDGGQTILGSTGAFDMTIQAGQPGVVYMQPDQSPFIVGAPVFPTADIPLQLGAGPGRAVIGNVHIHSGEDDWTLYAANAADAADAAGASLHAAPGQIDLVAPVVALNHVLVSDVLSVYPSLGSTAALQLNDNPSIFLGNASATALLEWDAQWLWTWSDTLTLSAPALSIVAPTALTGDVAVTGDVDVMGNVFVSGATGAWVTDELTLQTRLTISASTDYVFDDVWTMGTSFAVGGRTTASDHGIFTDGPVRRDYVTDAFILSSLSLAPSLVHDVRSDTLSVGVHGIRGDGSSEGSGAGSLLGSTGALTLFSTSRPAAATWVQSQVHQTAAWTYTADRVVTHVEELAAETGPVSVPTTFEGRSDGHIVLAPFNTPLLSLDTQVHVEGDLVLTGTLQQAGLAFALPSGPAVQEVVTDVATQTLSNKTLSMPTLTAFTGTEGTVYAPPAGNLATVAGVERLTNKTIDAARATGTWVCDDLRVPSVLWDSSNRLVVGTLTLTPTSTTIAGPVSRSGTETWDTLSVSVGVSGPLYLAPSFRWGTTTAALALTAGATSVITFEEALSFNTSVTITNTGCAVVGTAVIDAIESNDGTSSQWATGYAHSLLTTNPHGTSLEQARQVSNTLAGPLVMGGHTVTEVPNPILSSDVANKAYCDALMTGLAAINVAQSRSISTPPTLGPSDRGAWLVPADATGAWAGRTNALATWSGQWSFTAPQVGGNSFVLDETAMVIFQGTAWVTTSSLEKHATLQGLLLDDHPQYVKGSGRTGGQTVVGGHTLTLCANVGDSTLTLGPGQITVAADTLVLNTQVAWAGGPTMAWSNALRLSHEASQLTWTPSNDTWAYSGTLRAAEVQTTTLQGTTLNGTLTVPSGSAVAFPSWTLTETLQALCVGNWTVGVTGLNVNGSGATWSVNAVPAIILSDTIELAWDVQAPSLYLTATQVAVGPLAAPPQPADREVTLAGSVAVRVSPRTESVWATTNGNTVTTAEAPPWRIHDIVTIQAVSRQVTAIAGHTSTVAAAWPFATTVQSVTVSPPYLQCGGFVVDGNNWVGINTAPDAPLHVCGTAPWAAHLQNNGHVKLLSSTGAAALFTTTMTPSALPLFHIVNNGQSHFYLQADGVVGLGTNSPEAALHVAGPSLRVGVVWSGTDDGVAAWGYTGHQAITQDETGATEVHGDSVTIKQQTWDGAGSALTGQWSVSGCVGIGTTQPMDTLDVRGTIRCTDIITTSDARLKKNTRPITPMDRDQIQSVLARLALHWYQWEGGVDDHLGVLAQEVQALDPRLVSERGDGILQLRTDMLLMYVIASLQGVTCR